MTPEEISLAVQAFLELEPEIQKAVVAIVHLLRKRKPLPLAHPSVSVVTAQP